MKASIRSKRWTGRFGNPDRQQGIVLVFAVVALFALVAMGALAMDVGNMILNKGKLQSMVDAAALSAARTLDLGGDQALATTAANQALNNNLAQTGLQHMSLDGATVAVQFSDGLPFVPGGSTAATFVRVSVSNVDLPEFFARLFPQIDEMVTASAVAGPSSALAGTCNLVPIVICGEDTPNFGYDYSDIIGLKYSAPDEEVGPGNFHLLRLPDAAGAADVRVELAGGYDSCFYPDEETGADPMLETEPGNKAGPVAQGLNTRFGVYSGGGVSAADYPPDLVTTEPNPTVKIDKQTGSMSITDPAALDFNLDDYLQEYADAGNSDSYKDCLLGNCVNKGSYRRVMAVPVGKCDGGTNGQGELPYLGLACFFLVQKVDQADAFIVGQFMENCDVANGVPGNQPNGKGPYKIQLYRDNLSGDS